MSRTTQHPGLNCFAWATAAATFALIGLGGLVTSKGAGMAVPDWPTTYGYNMFLFPVHLWTGGIFYEHTHRLFASLVGLLTVVLAGWLWIREPRRWLRWLGVAAVMVVSLQGILGGLRVTLFKDEIGIFHATLAQLFLVMTILIALFVSGRGEKIVAALREYPVARSLGWMVAATTVLILAQLVLGASMRHQHAGLAVPDFPLAYGKIWPPTDPAFVDQVNRQRIVVEDYRPITGSQIELHMAHRMMALVILALTVGIAWAARTRQGKRSLFSKLSFAWASLIVLQAGLGALTVWSNKAADVATAHVLLGAASLATGSVISIALVLSQGKSMVLARSGVGQPTLVEPRLMRPRPTTS